MKRNLFSRSIGQTVVLSAALSAIILPNTSYACDLCAVHSLMNGDGFPEAGQVTMGVSEQYSGYDSIKSGGKTIDNTADQFLHSSITQL